MGLIEDIGQMQREGRADSEIKSVLRQRGVSDSEIEGAMSQAMIKGAVDGGESYLPQGEQYSQYSPQQEEQYAPQEISSPVGGAYEGMEQSAMSPEEQYQSYSLPANEQYAPQELSYGGNAYPQYQPYQESVSSEVISEIAEQVVADKLSLMRDKMEESVGFKSIAEIKIKNVEERIEKIEKVIDKLQLAVLQRVAEYVEDVRDMKNELHETQKSFKAINSPKHSGERRSLRSELPDLEKRAF